MSGFNPYTDHDTYTTGTAQTRLLPGMYFYPRLLWVIIRSGLKAKYGEYSGKDWTQSSAETLRYLEKAGVRFQITGLQNIRSTTGPVVFVSNHMSTLETMVLPCLIQPRKNTTFVVKRELLDYPFFKHILGSRDPLTVGRDNPREDLKVVLSEGKRTLENGSSIILFPQRTRSIKFIPEEFNSLGVKLAARSNAPVIPVALASDAWGNGKLMTEVGRIDHAKTVHIAFGEPLPPEEDSGELHQAVIRFIEDRLKAWGREDCLTEL